MGITFTSLPDPPAAAFDSAENNSMAWFAENLSTAAASSPSPTERFKIDSNLKITCSYFFLQEKTLLWKDYHNKRKNGFLWDYVWSLFLLASFSTWRWCLLQCRKIHRSWNESFDSIKFPFQLNSSCLPDNPHLVEAFHSAFSSDLWLKGFCFYRVKWEWVHS